MKKILKLLLIALICVLLGLWSPWLYWRLDISQLFGVEKPNPISGLQVYSLGGELEVYIDNQKQEGSATPETSPLSVVAIEPGERLVRIVRKSTVDGAYTEFNKIINFVEGIDVVISYLLGPEDVFSEGHIITAEQKRGESYNFKLSTNVTDYKVFIDEVEHTVSSGFFTQEFDLTRQRKVRIQKNGYQSIEFTIFPEEQGERDKLVNYILSVEAKLLYLPVKVE